ncbi:YibE/F family protein [Geodermatophilus maliterrae]|uniref:YibE/F family protein n=1 Tax=Geodermatophilus maliterrae TaxID=3162531 RepID=A0ABV3XHH1_9ACTN
MPATPSHATSHGHSHSHGPDPDAPPPGPEVLARRRRAVWLMLLLLVPVGLATVIGLVALWPADEPTQAQQVAETYLPPGTTYPDARVVSLQELPCGEATCATAVVEVLEGEGAGDYQQVDLQAEVVANGVAEGDTIVLTRDPGADGGVSYAFSDFSRTTPMVVLAVAFAVVVGVVARLRGLAALLGLAFAFFVLLQFVLPGLLAGSSPTLVSLVGSAAIMFVVLYLAHGFSARTTTALVGTLFGLALVTVLGAVSVGVARLTGLTSEETTQLLTFDPTLDFSGLVIAGCVVAGLGVLNDVTITQASAIWQLHEVDPAMGWRDLYRRGMAVGRDHIASTVYTIVFAYAGAALPLLLLFEVYARPAGATLTSAVVAEEVIRTLVGGIALVLATPVTTAVGAFFATAAGTATGTAPEQRISALRARFAR